MTIKKDYTLQFRHSYPTLDLFKMEADIYEEFALNNGKPFVLSLDDEELTLFNLKYSDKFQLYLLKTKQL